MIETVTFYTQHLLSKYGFDDGDLLFDIVEERGLEVDHRDLLIAVVERLVIPVLEQDVEYDIIGTFHNPIRIRCIAGIEADLGDPLTPEDIVIPVSDIITIAGELPPDPYPF